MAATPYRMLLLLLMGLTLCSMGSAAPTVVSSSLEHIGGTEPAMENISLNAAFNDPQDDLDVYQLKLPVMYDTERNTLPELERAGADRTTTFRMTVIVDDFTPRTLRGAGQEVSWDREFREDGTVKVTITGRPIAVQQAEGSYSFDDWDGTVQADRATEAQFSLFARSFRTHSRNLSRAIAGTIVTTDAASVGTPALRRDAQGRKRIELRVSAPHYTVDGDVNTGIYEATLAPPLLDHWNVNSTDNLEAWYDGNTTDFTATRLGDGSIRVSMTPHYSSANVAVGQEESDLPLPLLVLWQLAFLYTGYTVAGVAALIAGAVLLLVVRRWR